jgi:ATP-dependent Clp protease ATP-binding subunit ClpB
LQESRPDELESVAREVALLKMEERSVAKDADSNDRLAELRARIADREARAQQLEAEWQREKRQLEHIKTRKRDIAAAKAALEKAQRSGDWSTASELK